MAVLSFYKRYTSGARAGLVIRESIEFNTREDALQFVRRIQTNPTLDWTIDSHSFVSDKIKNAREIVVNPTGGFVGKLPDKG